MAELVLQWHRFAAGDRRRIGQPIEIDYHDGLGRFGIEAVTEDGQAVVLYLSMIEACGLSAALRAEIGAASDRIATRRNGGSNSGNGMRPIRYNQRRRHRL